MFRYLKKIILWGSVFVMASVFAAPSADLITEHLRQKNWTAADIELKAYISEKPDQAWAYSSHAWALENLNRYDDAMTVARSGLKRWPDDAKISTALARVLIKKAETMPAESAHALFSEAAQIDPREYTEFCLARSFRSLGKFEEAIALMEKGVRNYPDSERFREGLPFTEYQSFKATRVSGNKNQMRVHTDRALSNLLQGKYNQYYPRLILRFGLRDIGDRGYFQTVYDRLLAHFPDDPWLHDDYGFQLYANYRQNNASDTALRATAISWRRKGYALYWKSRTLPSPVRGLDFPLKGRNIIWSEFGGSAMTHNGFANYCYDFAAVDEARNIAKPGTARKSNADYFMFGKPVFAVADGEIAGTIDGFPDNPPGGFSSDANTITIRHKGYASFYAHMKNGGILVKKGQRVSRGDLIGYVGNSGMSSESHLHFCIQADNTDDISVPFEFSEVTVEKKDGSRTRMSGFYLEDDVVVFP
ncbi:MAG: peptidoglycan DD-metalloendopeptidase family protein [Spirochaetia bacterium]|nr:peptidoglycan DD-metalloendopeptidase family protein [Spirochaetia bacterium]